MEAKPLRIILRFSSCNISDAVHNDTIYHDMKSFAYLRDIGLACAVRLTTSLVVNTGWLLILKQKRLNKTQNPLHY